MLYFSEMNYRGNHAGTKARNDAERILFEYGAHPINTRRLELRENRTGIQSNIANRLGFLRYYMDLLFVRDETVIVQYPMLAFDIQYEYVQHLSKRNKVFFLVHDIQSLRRNDPDGLRKEIQMLNLAHGLIVHNRFMEQRLIELGVGVQHYYRLNCFDYLYSGEAIHQEESADIAFAGNLEKSTFLGQMFEKNRDVRFALYGIGWNEELNRCGNVKYQGSFSPDEIPGKLIGRYGLVWDGDTTLGCTGVMGEYTRINNPHKLSLYIAAQMPVIVWKAAAIAEFVIKNRLGIAVDRIDNIKSILDEIPEEDYLVMKQNAVDFGKRLNQGCYLKDVLDAIKKDD